MMNKMVSNERMSTTKHVQIIRIKFDQGFWYEVNIENMRFFCCQVYVAQEMKLLAFEQPS